MKNLSALLLAFTILTGAAWAQRLPQTASPSNYKLHFTPDLKAATYAGEETIDLSIHQATASIAINAVEITFVSIDLEQNGQHQSGTAATNDETGIATLTFPRPLSAGPARLKIVFTGILNDKLRGFYLSKSKKRRYATTQFEPTDARRAFPSFDEPSYKATFDIALTIDKDDTAISNGAIERDVPGPGEGKHTLTFATTPKMSSYLVAMAVGDWKCSSGEQDGIPVRACSTPDQVQLTPYALKSAKEILHFYNGYYGIKYPFKKLDLLAVPDFEAGAMENTAAIFYREPLLLIDDEHASVGAHQDVFNVLAHEMAHQWFGDLVTMAWWNDIWLNEGFATWMTYKPMEAVHPEWKGEVEEAAETANTLTIDSRKTTRAIRQQATTSDQINELFDGIAYEKAASVLRMVEHFVGPEAFRNGVNQYLAAHAYGNASAEDFWGTVAKVSGKPVDKIMSSFTEQPGAPLLTVAPHCAASNTVAEEQERFFDNKSDLGSAPAQQWAIPVCTRTLAGETHCELFSEKKADRSVKACALGIYYNADGRGFYRTRYSAEALQALPLAKLNSQERIMLLTDEWALAAAAQESIANFLDIGQKFTTEPEGRVLETILSRLHRAYLQLVTESDRVRFQQYLIRTYSPILQQIGLDPKPGESAATKHLRDRLYTVLGHDAGDPTVIEHARLLAAKYLEDPDSVDASTGSTSLDIAAIHGDAKLYDAYLAALPRMKSPEQFYAVFYSLTSFTDPALVRRTILYATTTAVRNQDAAGVFDTEIGQQSTREVAWPFIKENWAAISKQFTTWSGSSVVRSTGSFCSDAAKQDIQKFFAEHPVNASERALKQAMEQIDGCMAFQAAQSDNLHLWLQRQPQP